jgi:phage-related protein
VADAQANQVATNERIALTAQQAAGSTSASAVALAKLAPAGQAFAHFVVDILEPAFSRLKAAAQTGFLPGLQTGISDLLPILPTFTGFIGTLATTMGGLLQQAGATLTDPFWTQFFAFVQGTANPVLSTLTSIVGHILTGFAGLSQAFSPVATAILQAFDNLAGRFQTFATNTAPDSPINKFVNFVQQSLPVVGPLLGNFASTIASIAKAASGTGLTELHLISDALALISKLPEPVLAAIAAVLPPLVLGMKAFSLALAIANPLIAAFDLEIDANPLSLIILGIVAALVALGVGIYELVTHWSSVWATMKQVASDVFTWFKTYIRLYIVDPWLDAVGAILTGAADAFGWVPGIGGKLKDAKQAFDDFKLKVDAVLGDTNAKLAEAVQHVTDFNTQMQAAGSTIKELGLGGVFQSTTGGLKFSANGNYLAAGEPSIIGEQGPELWIPNASGAVVSNRTLLAALASVRAPAGVPITAATGGGGVTFGDINIVGQPAPMATAMETVSELEGLMYRLGLT